MEPAVVVLEAPAIFLPLCSTPLPAVFLAPLPFELVEGFRIEYALLEAEELETLGC